MGATKRDLSGVFDADWSVESSKKSTSLDSAFHLTQNGMTFFTAQGVPEWTEVGVKMHMPQKGARKDHSFTCRGVVIECSPCQTRPGYRVTLMFLDLPKRAQDQINLAPLATQSASISISR